MPAREKKPAKEQKGSSPAAEKAAAVKKKKLLNSHRWRGGVVGGALRLVAASDRPYHVKFFGVATQKFAAERVAKVWRRKMSGALDRTANLWRVHPDMPNTIEMKLGRGKSVLYDESKHDTIVNFRWHFNKPSRVFTRGKMIVGPLGVNRREKKQRQEGQNKTRLSMLDILNRKDYRQKKRPTHGVVDLRLANLVNAAGEARERRTDVS